VRLFYNVGGRIVKLDRKNVVGEISRSLGFWTEEYELIEDYEPIKVSAANCMTRLGIKEGTKRGKYRGAMASTIAWPAPWMIPLLNSFNPVDNVE
jgi:hypothetical protein